MTKQQLTEGNVFGRIALNLYYYRTMVAHMRVEDLAVKAEVGIRVVTNIENRRHAPTIVTMLKLARALDINYEDFFKEPPTFNIVESSPPKRAIIEQVKEDLDNG